MGRAFQCDHFDILFVKFGPVDLLELILQFRANYFLVLFGIKNPVYTSQNGSVHPGRSTQSR